MRIIHYSEINAAARDPKGFVEECCYEYDQKCKDAAEKIAAHLKEHPIILLAGPSGSGKTTTALKVEGYLDKMGLETHTVSMDNYFLPKDQIKIYDENNQIDYESPHRIDIALLQEHMRALAKCETVNVPGFDFKEQDRIEGYELKRRKGELVLFEGIHALNPEVTGYDDISTCMYVSVRTRIQLPNGELVHPELIRAMRRIIRDRNFRGRKPTETLDMFNSVQRGENLYIAPFKQRAHMQFDTFHAFEPSLYRNYIIDDFAELKNRYDGYKRFAPISELINVLDPIPEDIMPKDSLVREFIGGSSLKY